MCPTSEMQNGRSLWWTGTLLDRRSKLLFVIRIYWLVSYLPTICLTLGTFGTGKIVLPLLDSQSSKKAQNTVLPSIPCVGNYPELGVVWYLKAKAAYKHRHRPSHASQPQCLGMLPGICNLLVETLVRVQCNIPFPYYLLTNFHGESFLLFLL